MLQRAVQSAVGWVGTGSGEVPDDYQEPTLQQPMNRVAQLDGLLGRTSKSRARRTEPRNGLQ